jgi:hypothetical protein
MTNRRVIISTKDLNINDVPLPNDDWRKISRFAITFDPRIEDAPYIGVDDLDKASSTSSLVELRNHLYVQQRRWHHFGRRPDVEVIAKLRGIIKLIRQKLTPEQ